MRNRREFIRNMAAAAAGVLAAPTKFLTAAAPQAAAVAPRRQVSVAGKRVKVVDIHAHCVIPDVFDVIKDTPLARKPNQPGPGQILGPARIQALDQRGIDVQVLSINQFWFYAADRDLASRIVDVQNRKLADWCSAHSDRFVALTSVALQHPDLAAEQLEHAVKELGMRGAAIGGHVEGEELSSPRFDPFWAKVEQLGVIVFMHPQGAENVIKEGGIKGRGDLGNIIGDPLETTIFLSHLIFEGTLDRFPGLRICAAHAGGYLPSYIGRTDAACDVRPNAKCANKKKPSEYFKHEIIVDSMILSDEGLRLLVDDYGPGQIAYGTDIPFNWPDSIDMILRAPYLTDAGKEAILGGNMVKILKL